MALPCFGAGPSQADCHERGKAFYVGQNDETTREVTRSLRETCEFFFKPTLEETLTGLTLLTRPSHGRLALRGKLRFRSMYALGHVGPHAFAVRLCGRTRNGAGCARVNDAIDVTR